MKKKPLIVTRHNALVSYLFEENLVEDADVLTHATAETVEGRHVWGVLPHSLSCLTASFTEVPLNLPEELRGKELTTVELRKYASPPTTYRVSKVGGEA
jgi:hypothetical protein